MFNHLKKVSRYLLLAFILVVLIAPTLPISTALADDTYEAFFSPSNEQIVTFGGTDWQTVDLDDYFGDLGADVSGAIVHVYNSSASTYADWGLRMKGSTDTSGLGVTSHAHFWAAIGVDANHQFEVYVPHVTNVKVYIVGYTTWDSGDDLGVYFYEDRIDYTPSSGSWITKDASSDAPNAIGLIFVRQNTSTTVYESGIRPTGSSYNIPYETTRQNNFGVIIGCSEGQGVDIYVENTSVKYYLVGYVTAGAEFDPEPVALTVPTSSWADMSAFPTDSTMVFGQVGTDDTIDNYGFRKNGDSLDIYDDMRATAFFMVGLDGSSVAEGHKGDATAPAVRWGYAIPTEIYEPPPQIPTVVTNAATGVDEESATLNGNLTSLGDYTPVDVYFQYGETTGYEEGDTTPQEKSETGAFDQEVTGLDSDTTYHFRAVVDYGDGYVYGADANFHTTSLGAPTIETDAASSVESNAARLNGEVTDMGGEGSVFVSFEYGKTLGYGHNTDEEELTEVDTYYADITSLDAGTTYHFRAILRYNVADYVYGEDEEFITTSSTGQCFYSVLPEEQVTLTSADTWFDVDLDDYVDGLGSNVTGVIVHMWDPNVSTSIDFGLRKKGSTDNRIERVTHTSNTFGSIGVNSSKVFQMYVGSTSSSMLRVYIVGYTTTGVTYFLNGQLLNTPTITGWQTVDASPYVPSNAIGLIFEVQNINTGSGSQLPGGLRMTGSSDNLTTGLSRHNAFFGIVGLDSNKRFQEYRGSTDINFWLVGYITTGVTFYTNKVNVTPSATGSWADLSPLPADGIMSFIEVSAASDTPTSYGLRQKGSSLDISNYPRYHNWAAVGVDSNGKAQGYRGSSISFWLVGYAAAGEAAPSPPEVTTLSANSVTDTSASLRANISSLGDYSTVVANFEYGLTSGLGSDSDTTNRSTTGNYSISIAELDPDTLYYFRAKLVYDETETVYGNTLTFRTLEVGDPSVSTGSATTVTVSSAVLQGTLDDLGDFTTVYVAFEWGTSLDFGEVTPEETKTAIGSFNADITGLDSGDTYFFRARARGAGGNYIYGSTSNFTTATADIGKPTNFKVTGVTATSISLSWTKGEDSTSTLIRFDTSGYPTTTTSGTQAYSGVGTTFTHSDLTEDTTYYYSAWGKAGSSYSSAPAKTSGSPSVSGIAIPDSMLIESVEVYRDYNSGQLFVIAYKLNYDDVPLLSASDYFRVEIREGDALRATGPVTDWGYRPAAIYLSGSGEVDWGGGYTVVLAGFPSKWATAPSTSYDLTSANWRGEDLARLDDWVINLALRMEDYYNTELTLWQPSFGTVLNDQGGEIFRRAIPNLTTERPNLFSSRISEIDVDMEERPTGYQDTLTANTMFGEEAMDKFESLGENFGWSGTLTAGFLWGGLLFLIMGAGTVVSGGHALVGIVASGLAFAIGGVLGFIPLAVILILGAILVIVSMALFWLTK